MKVDKKQEQKWEAEDDLRTLVKYSEIKKDKPRLRRAMALANEQRKVLAAIGKES